VANLRASAAALRHMSQAKPPHHVKLVDGGWTDNFGIQPLAIARYAGSEPYAPLTPEAATKLTRGLFLTVNSGRGLAGNWDKKLEHPGGLDVVMALSDVAIGSTSRNGIMDYFTFIIRGWERRLSAGVIGDDRQRHARPDRLHVGARPRRIDHASHLGCAYRITVDVGGA
jgi:NTE family protein